MGKLYVSAADDADMLDDLVGLLLQLLLQIFIDRQHGCRTEGISGVHAAGIHVLDETDRDHIVVLVADDLELELLPAQDRLLDQDLTDERCLQAAGTDCLQFFFIIYEAAAGTAHGIGGTEDDRITKPVGDRQGFLHTVGHFTAGHLDAQLVHCLLKLNAVLAALDGIRLNADDLDTVLIQNSFLVQLRAQIQSGLTAQIGKQGIRPLRLDDLRDPVHIQRLYISPVRHFRICHDRRRIRIDQDDLISQAPQSLTRLRPRVVKFARLPDYDRAGADDQYLVDVCSLGHELSSLADFHVCQFLRLSPLKPAKELKNVLTKGRLAGHLRTAP